ncbi:hypothetical protein [Paludisphaera mucosa]|uniref:Uncharacterized protein n=1 Tax=Paludisphaera mucosa TaxID=3030827 RepID=A0ABT6F7N3_9BACT|nr:hypothetical protein [Paludisphaera mucosa]MDG3003592.1 hypothetical protein [Paludisphaera mucosa]
MRSNSLCLAAGLAIAAWQPARADEPATVERAAAVLDLATFPLPPGAVAPSYRRLAGVSYEVKADAAGAYDFVKKALLGAEWDEVPGGYASAQAASGTFSKSGFKASVTAFPGAKPGVAAVTILNHGDVDTAALPVPAGATPFYETPVGKAYLAPGAVPATAEEVRGKLREQAWEPYGEAGDVRFYKRNAVKLSARVTAAPAQGGKTVVDYSSELMSADLPAPADASRAHYADVTKELSFDAPRDPKALFDEYSERLAKLGWKAVRDAPSKERIGEALFFRNAAQELLSLHIQTIDGQSRGLLRHMSAAEVEEMLAAKETPQPAPMRKPKPEIRIAVPAEARDVTVSGGRIEYRLAAGRAKASVQALLAGLKKDGWKEQVAVLEDPAGAAAFLKGELNLSVTYTDAGLGDAEVDVDAIGATLKRIP